VGATARYFPLYPTTFLCVWVQQCYVKVEIDPSELVEKSTDSRGRLTLGTDYANQNVKVLILNE